MRPLSSNRPSLSRDNRLPAIVVGVLLLGSGLLFGYTLAPGLLWGDDAMFQRALAMGTSTPHPVWDLLARCFARLPWGEFAFRANLASAVYAVGAVGFVFLTVLALGGGVRAAVASGAILTFSQAFWLHAVRAEVYTLHLLLFFGGLWAFLRWRQATTNWAWFMLGLAFWLAGTVNHLLLTMAFPGGLWLLLSAVSPSGRTRLAILLALFLGAGTALVAVAAPAFFTEVLPVAVRNVLASLKLSPPRVLVLLAFLVYQFPLLGILAVPGFRCLWHRDKDCAFALFLIAIFTVAFAVAFSVQDAYVFCLPAYGLIAICAGLGLSVLTTHWRWAHWLLVGAMLLTLQVGIYRAAPAVLQRLAPGFSYARDLPGRPANTFFLWPPKRGYIGARWYAETAFDLLPSDAVVVADWTLCTPLWYLQEVEGRRRDVLVLEMSDAGMQVICENNGRRPLFLANDDPRYYPVAKLTESFSLQPVGPVFELIPTGSKQ